MKKILMGHIDDVNSVKFFPDEKYIASRSHDKTIIIWNSITGFLYKKLEGH
jgi:WD40 repeat protein